MLRRETKGGRGGWPCSRGETLVEGKGGRQRGCTSTQRETGGQGAVEGDAESHRDDKTARHKRRCQGS